MKKVKYPNLNDYDLSAYEELKGDILYRINGGKVMDQADMYAMQQADAHHDEETKEEILKKYESTETPSSSSTTTTQTTTTPTTTVKPKQTTKPSTASEGATSGGTTTPTSGNTTTTVNTTSSPKTEPSAYGNDVLQKQETGNEAKRSKGLIGKAFSSAADTIKDAFGGDKFHARLAAGQPFDSIEMAAIAWAITYSDDSICTMREYGSTIYSYETEVVKDGKKQTVTRYSYNLPNSADDDPRRVTLNENLLPGQVAVSAIHSHADYDPGVLHLKDRGDHPSEDDIAGVKAKGYKCEYLVTPLGHLYSFDKEGSVEAIKTGIPLTRDPWADYPGNDILTEQNRLFANFRPDPHIDRYGRIINQHIW